ncbi:MAG: hypothetical protein ABL907_03965 [Hyphomicrobium sp.]
MELDDPYENRAAQWLRRNSSHTAEIQFRLRYAGLMERRHVSQARALSWFVIESCRSGLIPYLGVNATTMGGTGSD